MSDTEQTVVDETDGQAAPGSEDVGAQDTLDEVLKEFDALEIPTEQPTQQKVSADDVRKVVDFVSRKEEEEVTQQTQTDIAAAVKTMQESLKDAPVKLSERLLRGALHEKAASDPRFLKAFQSRRDSPSQWEKVLQAAATEIKQDLSVDTEATETRAAVESAVHSANKATQPDELSRTEEVRKFAGMSDAELNAFKRQQRGF